MNIYFKSNKIYVKFLRSKQFVAWKGEGGFVYISHVLTVWNLSDWVADLILVMDWDLEVDIPETTSGLNLYLAAKPPAVGIEIGKGTQVKQTTG